MTKLLCLEIQDICEECPYLLFDNEWGGYTCSKINRTFEFDSLEAKYTWEKEIPEWCPLPTKV